MFLKSLAFFKRSCSTIKISKGFQAINEPNIRTEVLTYGN